MIMMKTEPVVLCPVCGEPIDQSENRNLIWDMYSDELSIVDYGGVEALTEPLQMLYHNLVHAECYECLECTQWCAGYSKIGQDACLGCCGESRRVKKGGK